MQIKLWQSPGAQGHLLTLPTLADLRALSLCLALPFTLVSQHLNCVALDRPHFHYYAPRKVHVRFLGEMT